jgi:hypothetical protein
MFRPLCFVVAISLVAQARAEKLPLRDGRYVGEVAVFSLTAAQKGRIEKFRECHLAHASTMNIYTPYVFKLTSSQSKSIKRLVGYSPKYFQIYETFLGFNDAGPHWNIALRFSETQIEIPVALLLSATQAEAEFKEQGWSSVNPCFPDVTS